MTVLSVLGLIGLLWLLAYRRASNVVWVALPPIYLVTVAVLDWMSGLWLWGFADLYIAGLALYAFPNLRRRWVSRPLLMWFRQVIPRMSDTEREALEAGTVWWDAELFSGRPDWNRLLDFPAPSLSEEEQAFIKGPVDELCRRLDDWEITHETLDLPPDIWDFIKQSGLFGMIIPKQYGGLEFSAYAHSAVVMKLASRSITAAVSVMVPNSLGPAKLLLHYGTDEQKQYYLPRLAQGKDIPCFALTGPKAGSDAGAMPDNGVICYGQQEGRKTLGIRLNWDKRYITLGPIATVIGLAFRLSDPEKLLGREEDLGITVALIPRHTPGIEIGERHIPLNIPFQNGPNRGRDVFVPLTWVIGGPDGIGQGWRMLVETLAEGRGISLPALATGACKMASRYTGAYARVRYQFNQPIGYFEGVEEALARIAGRTYQMDAARILTLGALDAGERPSVISAIVKYHLTERYRQVLNDAMDIQGGSGICLGPSNLIGRAYQAIPISITVEGANILTRSMIIFGQGAIRCHPYVLREFSAAQTANLKAGTTAFDDVLFEHVGFVMSNLARILWLGITRGRLSRFPVNDASGSYFRHLDWMTTAFALCADASLMTLGGSLKRRERLSSRLGDILSLLYLASSVLKRYQDEGAAASDTPLMQWAMEDLLYDIQHAYTGLLRNLPVRPLAWLLRALIFPTGMPFRGPNDRLSHQVARILLAPSAARDRLTAGVFITDDPGFAEGRLELAFEAMHGAAPLVKLLRKALRTGRIGGDTLEAQIEQAVAANILSPKEARRLQHAEQLMNQVIRVDAFSSFGQKEEVDQPQTTCHPLPAA